MNLKITDNQARELGIRLPTTAEDKQLSPNQIAKILCVTGEAVKHWIYTRKLPAIKLKNGYWVVKVSDFEHFLERRRAGVKPLVFVEAADDVKQAVRELGCHVVNASNLADALLERKKKLGLAKRTTAILIGAITDAERGRANTLGVAAVVCGAGEAVAEIERLMNIAKSD